MDLEQLTKHQILLLTLLVSFVTSIATGIVTVSLMDQAPEGVTRVINQIVERTVETVVPDNQSAAVATEKTVVVQQDEVVPQSIAKVQQSVIRIVKRGEDDVIARGLIVNSNGLGVTERAALENAGTRNFEALLPSGERVALEVSDEKSSSLVVFVQLPAGTAGVMPATIADSTKLTLGQSVIRISGTASDTVGEGVVAALPVTEGDRAGVLEASVASSVPGSVLITIFGEVIGIAVPSLSSTHDTYSVIVLPSNPTATNPASSS